MYDPFTASKSIKGKWSEDLNSDGFKHDIAKYWFSLLYYRIYDAHNEVSLILRSLAKDATTIVVRT